MSQYIAEFEKVSFDQWCSQFTAFNNKTQEVEPISADNLEILKAYYDDLKVPQRATVGSAGYDFFVPYDLPPIGPWRLAIIPTGWKCKIQEGWVLMLCSKSGLAAAFETVIDGGAMVVDSDYYNNPNNEGHIIISIKNGLFPVPKQNQITGQMEVDERQMLPLRKHQPFCQGVFLPFGLANEAPVTATRIGGHGSTYIPQVEEVKEDKPAEPEKPKSSLILP